MFVTANSPLKNNAMIRLANAADAKLLADIRSTAILAQPTTIWTSAQLTTAANAFGRDYLQKELEQGQQFYIFGEVGFTSTRQDYLAYLFVLPTQQKTGLGKQMLKFAEDKIANSGHNKAWLWAHPYSENFYNKNGYIIQPQTHSPFGLPLNKFEKSL